MYKKMAQDNPDKYGKNGGQSWTEEEHEKLLKEVQKKSLSEIAIVHERTENAIRARLKYLARKMINDGSTIEEAQKKVKLVSIDEIKKFISSENHKKEVKNNNKELLKEAKEKKDKDVDDNKEINILEELKNKILELENKNKINEERILKLEEKIYKKVKY